MVEGTLLLQLPLKLPCELGPPVRDENLGRTQNPKPRAGEGRPDGGRRHALVEIGDELEVGAVIHYVQEVVWGSLKRHRKQVYGHDPVEGE
eukprot:10474640-Lingulodinium_polyedra.AAC.1